MGRKKRLQDQGRNLPNDQQEVVRLTQEVKVNQDMYDSLMNLASVDSQELQMARTGGNGNVQILDHAVASLRPVWPLKPVVLGIGTALGVLVGIGLVMLDRILRPPMVEDPQTWLNSGRQARTRSQIEKNDWPRPGCRSARNLGEAETGGMDDALLGRPLRGRHPQPGGSMSLRSNLGLPHHGLVWLALSIGGLAAPHLAAMYKETKDRQSLCGSEFPDGKAPHAQAPEQGGTPGESASPSGFEQWIQELNRQAANPGPDPGGTAQGGMALDTLPLLPSSAKVRMYVPGSDARARHFGAYRGQVKTGQEFFQEVQGSLSGRSLHPFFAVRGDERTGKVSRLHISSGPGRTEQPPRELAVQIDHGLSWVCESGGGFQTITPVGSHQTLCNAPIKIKHFLVRGEMEWGVCRTWVMATKQSALRSFTLDLPEPLGKGSRQPVGSEAGDQVFVPMPEHVLHLRLEGAGPALKAARIPGTPETRDARLMCNRAGTVLVHARPDQPFLYVRRVGDEVGTRVATASGGFPVCLAQGAGAEVWFIQVRPFGIGWLDTDTMSLVHLHPRGRSEEVQEPHEAALGPDGNLWFTDRKGCRIGRIIRREEAGEPVGEVTLFDLGKGQHPEEIICSPSVWLYFTLKDQAVVGSIRAVDARPEDACGPFVPRPPLDAADLPEAAAGVAKADAATGKAARPGRKLSGAERRKRQQARAAQEALAKPRSEDREPAPGNARDPSGTLALQVEETKAPPPATLPAGMPPARKAPAPRQRTPRERLEAMYVQVEDGNLERHILKRHAAESRAKASKFAPRYSDPAGLLRLLADALDGAEIGRELRTDRTGNVYTTCSVPGVGQCNGQETNTFTVVTRIGWNKRTSSWWHDLVTAYPGE